MAFQTGTIANLNDVLRTLRDFLSAQGWTTHVNYRQPMLLNRINDHRAGPPPFDVFHWRWNQRLAMSKGTKFFTAQDFYLQGYALYGTGGAGNFTNGPGIAICAGTAAANDGVDEASIGALHPAWYRPYTLAGDGVTPVYAQDLAGPPIFPDFNTDVVNPTAVMVMPLPMVTGQENGTWATGDFFWVNGYPNNDTELPAPFGVPGGPAVPIKYWLFHDANDNWMMVLVHDTIAATIKTVYMGMGTINKAGNWAGNGEYLVAARAAANAFTGTDVTTYPLLGHEINRFAPPGAVADDGGATLAVRLPGVDADGAGPFWYYLGTGGRRILSTAEMEVIITGPLGSKSGLGFRSMIGGSSMVNAAMGLPVYLTIVRDSGLQSMIGSLPGIRQAHTFGFPFGYETLSPNGDTWVVFDGFIIKKVP
jgi:hypothetical protein